ncbi:MAG: HsdR family type I site-specific deoxyribonuclease [Firmicutes bacterium]|nr:HsdR family type I site-specific deoxyribonuclease [Bacillota bacterium]
MNPNISQTQSTEKTHVEEPFLQHLERLNWTIERWNGGKGSRNDFPDIILEEELKTALLQLNPWLTESQAENLCIEIANFSQFSLVEKNREGDNRLQTGFSEYDETTAEDNKPVKLLDYSEPQNNRFLAVSQMRIQRLEKEIIPDIVLFVNGLPLVVVECKSPKIAEPFFAAVAQIDRYKADFPELFHYNQFVVATSRHDTKYATITGKSADYLEWKQPHPFSLAEISQNGEETPSQEKLIWGMLSPANLLDIIRNYTVWDGAKKKTPRYNQYRAANKIVQNLRNNQLQNAQKSGTIWHTQGSGKTLTMMYVIRQMFQSADLHDWKIVLIVDRDDLQKQSIQASGVLGYEINVAKNMQHCRQLIASNASDVVVAMVHKFGEFFTENSKKDFQPLNQSEKILILIDEAHRSQYGVLTSAMIEAMPNAVKIAFSGTPTTRTTDTFGRIIDQYNMQQAVQDGVVVEIRYEGKATNSNITDENALNDKFIDVFCIADEDEQQQIMGRYTFAGYMTAENVIAAKAENMLNHYLGTAFQNGFKAQVAAYNREAAFRYKIAFEQAISRKIIELQQYNPLNIDICQLEKMRVECIISAGTDDANRYPHLKNLVDTTDKDRIIGDGGLFKTPFKVDKKGEEENGENGGNVGIIIVSDMLLTGFDAPILQVLYLDKMLTNHGLLQAIARVNRLFGTDKKCGYVVDYIGITQHLKKALSKYDDLDENDYMLDISKEIDRLNSAYNEIMTFIRQKIGCNLNQQELIIEKLVAAETLRNDFNELFKQFTKFYDIVLPNPQALLYRAEYENLAFIRASVANRTRNARFSMQDASAKVRAIIEEFLQIQGISVGIPPIDIMSPSFIADVAKLDKSEQSQKSDRAIANELEYAVREYIIENTPRDPELFERFSERLTAILEQFKENWQLLRTALENFIKTDISNARKNENNFGYDFAREMPFFSLLRKEIFGSRMFDDLKTEEFNSLKTLTDGCIEHLQAKTTTVDFWERSTQIQEMRTYLRNLLLDMNANNTANMVNTTSIREKANDIVQKIIDLGKEHYS